MGLIKTHPRDLFTYLPVDGRLSVRTRADYPLGRLAFKDEPGKVRVFAMVDCITQ
jgi:hypothetical protein